jgi:CubicO group peptidase (beta-lactamase class C family)
MIIRTDGKWVAEIAGQRVNATAGGMDISAKFAENGEFHGMLAAKTNEIRGHWIQPATVSGGLRYASPITLKSSGKDRWRGEVVPLEDEITLFLVATMDENGVVHAFLRNPELNVGFFLNIDRMERDGDTVKLIGHRRGQNNEQVLAQGLYHSGSDPSQDQISIYFPSLNGTYDFSRASDDSLFYARGKTPAEYHYSPPPSEDDGWPTSTLSSEHISEAPIKKLIETLIDPPAKSVHDPYIHGILIARHGKLVFEEYFHGFHRDKPHDTRSASKSATATLTGSLIQHGAPIGVSTPVYKTIYGDQLPADLDPRKKQMTVEHLLMMTSGFFCDDRNPAAPGNEDVMQSQTADQDWYHYTLNVPMADNPGEKPVYCSANPNLLGDVLTHATGKPLTELFQERIAAPLQIKHYYLNLSPTGHPYMGGGIYWLPRDFMKLGQVMLNGGTWNGQRIVSAEWAQRSTSPLEHLRKLQYGYFWWSIDCPYKGKTVHAFFAGGNGGQIVMGIPDLDLVVAFYAGNYSDPVRFRIQEELVPQYILSAVDAKN